MDEGVLKNKRKIDKVYDKVYDGYKNPNKVEIKLTKKIIRCSFCNKKCTLINYTCKCGGTFCQNHRLSHSHSCSYLEEKKSEMKEKIKINNQLITADKVVKIDHNC